MAAIVAGSLSAALVSAPRTASAQQLSNVPQTACRAAASGQVATSSRGRDAQWGRTALDRLCTNAETTQGPGECFTFTMTSNSVPWAPGQTHWNSDNAVRLCAGAVDSGRRVNCFVARTSGGTGWSQAIDQCIAEERTMSVQAPRITAPTQVITSGPATPAPGDRQMTLEEYQAARAAAMNTAAVMHCRGPLQVSTQPVNERDPTQGTYVTARFTAASSATNLQPGQCWRTGGWGREYTLMNPENEGMLTYTAMLGNCPLIRAIHTENGVVTEITTTDRGIPYALLRAGINNGPMGALYTRYVGGDMSSGSERGPRLYAIEVPADIPRPNYCQ